MEKKGLIDEEEEAEDADKMNEMGGAAAAQEGAEIIDDRGIGLEEARAAMR